MTRRSLKELEQGYRDLLAQRDQEIARLREENALLLRVSLRSARDMFALRDRLEASSRHLRSDKHEEGVGSVDEK